MSSSLTPGEGARLLLELEHDGGSHAVYRVAMYTPGATFEGRASLHDDGTFELAAPGAPANLIEALAMLAKLTARSAATKRVDGRAPWPPRVLRWRGPGRGQD